MSSKAMAMTSAWRGWRGMVACTALAVSATVALSAWAQPGPGGPHGGGMGGPGFVMGGRGLDRMLDAVNATDAQRAQIRTIVQQARQDMQAQREQHRTLRERGLQILTAPTLDPAAAESVRQQMVQQHDANSRRMLQAMLDVSGVLTPEQRAQLGERIRQRQERMQQRMQEHGQPGTTR